MIENADVFQIKNNVHIAVLNSFGDVKQELTVHNKCTRTMVIGLLKHLLGKFETNKHGQIEEDNTQYLPKYFNVGYGGVNIVDGKMQYNENERDADGNLIPELVNWDNTVSYTATRLVKEFNVKERSKINAARTTIGNKNHVFPDMDSIYYHCEIPTNQLNPEFGGNKVFITELGLFSDNIPGDDSLLAYVKLSNYTTESSGNDPEVHTNTVWLNPTDTLVIHWVITIAAIGADTRFATDFVQYEDEDEADPRIVTDDVNEVYTIPNKPIQIYTENLQNQ